MFWLVTLAVDIFGLAGAHVHHRANSLRLADNARVLCFSSFADLCWFACDQTLGDQRVAADLKGVEVPNTHTAFEESAILGAFSRKFAHFLENRDLDSFSLLAPSGALVVIMVYYIPSAAATHFSKFFKFFRF